MKYFARITQQKDKSYLVEFPELEGCFTEGKTLTKAKENASEALNGWLASCCDCNLNIPYPKQRRGKNFYPIMVDFQISLAIVLKRKRKQKRLSQIQIAKKLGITQQTYTKLEASLKTNLSLTTLQELLKALNIESHFDTVA